MHDIFLKYFSLSNENRLFVYLNNFTVNKFLLKRILSLLQVNRLNPNMYYIYLSVICIKNALLMYNQFGL